MVKIIVFYTYTTIFKKLNVKIQFDIFLGADNIHCGTNLLLVWIPSILSQNDFMYLEFISERYIPPNLPFGNTFFGFFYRIFKNFIYYGIEIIYYIFMIFTIF